MCACLCASIVCCDRGRKEWTEKDERDNHPPSTHLPVSALFPPCPCLYINMKLIFYILGLFKLSYLKKKNLLVMKQFVMLSCAQGVLARHKNGSLCLESQSTESRFCVFLHTGYPVLFIFHGLVALWHCCTILQQCNLLCQDLCCRHRQTHKHVMYILSNY